MYPLVSAVKCFIPFTLILIVLRNEIDASKIVCKNNGKQTTENNKIICQCPYPFAGMLCEDYACVNGLSTGDQYKPHSAFFNKRCLCDAGWTGELCETSLINRCGENGKERRGKCMCQKNFVGDRCQFVSKCAHGQLYNG
uniref:EGF-like domain-containing protein n=1 Tax=Plectus sambesii TaxID=2011161 RepID=A0A914UJS0_9BILA